MAKEIKLSAGDTVYWLSSSGFKKGWIKKIIYSEEVSSNEESNSPHLIFEYYLTSNSFAKEYRGDTVPEKLVFTSYYDMIKYYSDNEPE